MNGKTLTDTGNRIFISKKVAMKLSEANQAYFKCQFDGINIQNNFNIMSIDYINHPSRDRKLTSKEKGTLLRALCNFIDRAIEMTITDVEREFGRPNDDKMDFTNDIDGNGKKVQLKHFAIGHEGLSKAARIHGFYNNKDVFIIKRIDWNHRFHQK